MQTGLNGITKFDDFIADFTDLVEAAHGETELIGRGSELLQVLVAEDDWLPGQFAEPDPERYRQYLLYRDPVSRFCVVSFVWGPGQKTPVHDHQVWGLIGMLRGAEDGTRFTKSADGTLVESGVARLLPGEVEAVSPTIGDIHRVSNAFSDKVSVSIHIYGADIGTVSRHVFDPATGSAKTFISGYANA